MAVPQTSVRALSSDLEAYVRDRIGFSPGTGVILGSGLSRFTEELQQPVTLPYEDIPGFPTSGVEGHRGQLVAGTVGREKVVVASGRFHWYEGYDWDEITLPVRLFHSLGVTNLIITNASGSVRREFPPGTLMAITGHMDFTFRESPETPEIANDDRYHSRALLRTAKGVAERERIDLKTGVYAWTLGPSFETRAEIEFIRDCGGHVVGMSTVPEIQAGGELGLNVLGISCLTNYGTGITDQPLTHEDVIKATQRVAGTFSRLIKGVIEETGSREENE